MTTPDGGKAVLDREFNAFPAQIAKMDRQQLDEYRSARYRPLSEDRQHAHDVYQAGRREDEREERERWLAAVPDDLREQRERHLAEWDAYEAAAEGFDVLRCEQNDRGASRKEQRREIEQFVAELTPQQRRDLKPQLDGAKWQRKQERMRERRQRREQDQGWGLGL